MDVYLTDTVIVHPCWGFFLFFFYWLYTEHDSCFKTLTAMVDYSNNYVYGIELFSIFVNIINPLHSLWFDDGLHICHSLDNYQPFTNGFESVIWLEMIVLFYAVILLTIQIHTTWKPKVFFPLFWGFFNGNLTVFWEEGKSQSNWWTRRDKMTWASQVDSSQLTFHWNLSHQWQSTSVDQEKLANRTTASGSNTPLSLYYYTPNDDQIWQLGLLIPSKCID